VTYNPPPPTAASIGAASAAALTAEAATRLANDNTLGASIIAVAQDTQAASYVLVLADQGKAVEMNNAAANNCTIPPHSAVAFPVGAIIEIFQYGAGQTSIVAGAGVTLRSPSGKVKIGSQFGSVTIRQRATDEWCLEGDLTA
jgi:hypothetical protein